MTNKKAEKPLDPKAVRARAEAALALTAYLTPFVPKAAAKPPAAVVELSPEEIKARRKRRSGHVLKSTPHASAVILGFNPYHDRNLDSAEMMDQLTATIGQVGAGDLSSMEAMLVSQATALQSIFSTLAVKAAAQSQIPNLERLLNLALKAQGQSRATISALVDLKYPRQVSFVKQTNNAQGAMQVNNGVPVGTGPEPAPAVAQELLQSIKEGASIPVVQPQLEDAPKARTAVARTSKKPASAKRTIPAADAG